MIKKVNYTKKAKQKLLLKWPLECFKKKIPLCYSLKIDLLYKRDTFQIQVA